MGISELCIKRPVFASVINIMLVLLGIIAFDRLTIREYPKIDEPVVTVETHYLGASAEIIETQVTKTLEDSLAGIEGIEVMSSISRSEVSQITLRFKIERDPNEAANDVRDRVGRVRDRLPDEVDEPIIAKVEADAQPIIYLAFYSSQHSPMEITDYADRYVRDRIKNLSGVADVSIIGERRASMRIWLKPERLAAYNITVQEVENALRAQNTEIPAGRIESTQREFTVLSESDLRTKEQFEEIILKRSENGIVKLSDVGYAEVQPQDERRIARFNGQNAVALGVIKQATANPLDVSRLVNQILPEVERDMPPGMEIKVAYDSSVFIDRSINAVYHTIGEAVLLVVLVIFIFLRNFRSTLIPIITIPVSLIGTFMIMYWLGFSINTLTLLALVLAIGLVVDDAIVVLENIYRHIEDGMPPMEAALLGSKEITFAVIAMTITLAAVYTPVAFITGTTGKLFTEFAISLAGAVIISGFIALTLSPMLCSRLLKHEKPTQGVLKRVEHFFDEVDHRYRRLLGISLGRQTLIVVIGLIVAGLSVLFFTLLKKELAPVEDRGTIIGIVIAPEGATIDYTTKWIKQLEPIYQSIPEVEKYFVVAGFPVVNRGITFMRLKDWDDRSVKQQDITAQIGGRMFGIPGILAFPVNPPSLGRSARSQPVEFVVQTTGTYEELNKVVGQLMNEARQFPGLANMQSDLKTDKPQIAVAINRDKAAAVGVQVETIGRTLETMLGGRQVTRYKDEGEQYDVIVQIADEERTSPNDLNQLYVRGGNGEMIQLSNLVEFEETVSPPELNHFNQLRAAKITATLTPGTSLGEALKFLEGKMREISKPGTSYDFDGESREFRSSSASLAITFILALGFIFLVLAAQFESWVSPFIIMLSVPLSMTGALMALYLAGGTLNIYSQIGLITLIGLITKHGILIVEFANQLREKGKKKMEAIAEAAALRLRPILMTSGTMILGAMPLALASGAGAESRAQIGWVIIGGMGLGTLFTLFVIPVVYLLLSPSDGPKPVTPQKH